MLKVIEVLAESDKSWEDAAAQAVSQTEKTVHKFKSIQNSSHPGAAPFLTSRWRDL